MWAFCLLSGRSLGGGGLARELIIFFFKITVRTSPRSHCVFFFGITAFKEIFAVTFFRSNVPGST